MSQHIIVFPHHSTVQPLNNTACAQREKFKKVVEAEGPGTRKGSCYFGIGRVAVSELMLLGSL